MPANDPGHRTRQGRNIAVFVILLALAVLIFAVTLVKLGAIGAPG